MGKVKENIDASLQEWIEEQPMFFVATAPIKGHINVSPKGYDSLRVIDPTTVTYLDLTGSGAETIAHLIENQRITLMWCAFSGKPNIVRVYGKAEVHHIDSDGFTERSHLFDELAGARAIIETKITRVSTSCGWSIPEFEYSNERPALKEWIDRRGPDGVREYQTERNQSSIDNLPTNIV